MFSPLIHPPQRTDTHIIDVRKKMHIHYETWNCIGSRTNKPCRRVGTGGEDVCYWLFELKWAWMWVNRLVDWESSKVSLARSTRRLQRAACAPWPGGPWPRHQRDPIYPAHNWVGPPVAAHGTRAGENEGIHNMSYHRFFCSFYLIFPLKVSASPAHPPKKLGR